MITVLVVLAVIAAAILVIAVVRARRAPALPELACLARAGNVFSRTATGEAERIALARADADELRDVVLRRAGALDDADERAGLEALAGEFAAAVDRQLRSRESGVGSLDILLFGKTKAGKSSVFTACTGELDGIGIGTHNTTREPRPHQFGRTRLVDPPGVKGANGRELESRAWHAVPGADLIVLQVTDDALNNDDREHLARLARLSVPVVVALNVKRGAFDWLDRPELVFGPDLAEYAESVRTLAGEAGLGEVAVQPLHALSAAEARHPRSDATRRLQLWEASRLGPLLERVEQLAAEAAAYAVDASDEIVLLAHGTLDLRLRERTDALRAGVAQTAADRGEVEGILASLEQSALAEASIVDAHFGKRTAEVHRLVDGFGPKDSLPTLTARVERALAVDELVTALEQRRRALVESVRSRLEDFSDDRELALKLRERRAKGHSTWSSARDAWRRERLAELAGWLARGAQVVLAALSVVAHVPFLAPFVGTLAGRVRRAAVAEAERQRARVEAARRELRAGIDEDVGDRAQELRVRWRDAVRAVIADADGIVVVPLREREQADRAQAATLEALRVELARVVDRVVQRRYEISAPVVAATGRELVVARGSLNGSRPRRARVREAHE